MKKQRLFVFLFFLFLFGKSYSQGVLITQPRLESDGNQLLIFYDIVAKNSADKFYIWVEMEKANGEKILAKTLSGDIGENIKAGNNKKIIWAPEQDSIYLKEEIFVEVKAERYVKSFDKGSMFLRSAIFPGWGQTKISKGKPWWLTGIAVYGTLAGGYVYYKNYLKSYDSYRAEEDDPLRRADLAEQAKKQQNISMTMIYSAASAWAVNVLWVTFTPNRYQLLQHVKFSLNSSPSPYNRGLLLSLKWDF
jgi:hypothetical protein